jgi:hypothetical protein
MNVRAAQASFMRSRNALTFVLISPVGFVSILS